MSPRQRLRGLPVAAKLPLLLAGLMIVLGAVASERVLTRLGDLQAARLRDLAGFYFDGLSVAILPAAIRGDVWEAFDALDRATQQDRSVSALVTTLTTGDGVVLASSDPRRFPSGALLAPDLAVAPTPESLTLSSEPTVAVRSPLRYQGRPIGELHAELDVTALIAERRRAIVYLLAGNMLATGLLSLIGYLVARRMLRPLSTLADHMGRDDGPEPIVAALVPAGGNEFGRLFRQYNALVASELARKADARRLAEQERLVSLGRLASSVAHEVNNPLGGLLNAVDTLRRHGHRPEVSEQSIALLERGLLGIRDVVRAMLETHRPPSSGLLLSHADFEDLRLLIAPELRRQKQSLDWRLDADAFLNTSIEGGPVRQAVLNLLLNAAAAAGPGGGVRVRVERDADTIGIAVANGGTRVPSDVRRSLGAGQSHGGGVGLTVVTEICRELGGVMRLDEADDETRFVLEIPTHPATGGCAA